LILWCALQLRKISETSGKYTHFGLIFPGLFVVITLILFERDLGTALLVFIIASGILFLSGASLKPFLALAVAATLVGGALILTNSYRMNRFGALFDPFDERYYKFAGWQPAHSIMGLASGGLWGSGLGASKQKWANLAEAHTDFIFSVIGEELGLVGTLGVLILIATLVYSIFRIALRAQDPMTRYACAGIGVWIAVQSFLNIGSATSLLPVVGVTLPLVSYGGSALVATIAALGFVAGAALRDPEVRQEIVKKRQK